MDRPSVAVVVPTIREESFRRWADAWRDGRQLDEVMVIVVEDNPEPTFAVDDGWRHVSWRDIERDMGNDAWIIPRRTDCVRSYGYLLAWQAGVDVMVTIDDDCLPGHMHPITAMVDAVMGRASEPAWWSTLAPGFPNPRGIPYQSRSRSVPVAVHMGVWCGVPDLDAPTTLHHPDLRMKPSDHRPVQTVPRGQYFPMCGMHLAVRREWLPACYFTLQGQGEPYDRFGDIWAGVFLKRIADHLGWAMTVGPPHVNHDRASNVWANLRKEAPGLEPNETLWQVIDQARLTGTTVAECYGQLLDQLPAGDYWDRLSAAGHRWLAWVS